MGKKTNKKKTKITTRPDWMPPSTDTLLYEYADAKHALYKVFLNEKYDGYRRALLNDVFINNHVDFDTLCLTTTDDDGRLGKCIILGTDSNMTNAVYTSAIMDIVTIPWIYTQSIYKFSEELGRALDDTPLIDGLYMSALDTLPERTMFVQLIDYEIKDTNVEEDIIFGAYVQITDDVISMVLLDVSLMDFIHKLYPSVKYIKNMLSYDYTTADANQLIELCNVVRARTITSRAVDGYMSYASDGITLNEKGDSSEPNMDDPILVCARRVLNRILYLCSENGTHDPGIKRTTKRYNANKRDTSQLKIPAKPRVFKAGEEFAKQVREYKERVRSSNESTGQSVTPHLRRAHWHTYYTGPRNSENRKQILKWIQPIFVNTSLDSIK